MKRMLVLDQSVLRNNDGKLESLFRAGDIGLLCDISFKEMVKGNPEVTMRMNLRTIAQYPGQVSIVRGQDELNLLTFVDGQILADDLIDAEATQAFPEFLSSIQAEPNVLFGSRAFQKNSKDSKGFFESLGSDTEQVRSSIIDLTKRVDPVVLKSLRRSFQIDVEQFHPVANRAWKVLEEYCRRNNIRIPDGKKGANTFMYRFFLSGVVLEYYWLAAGGIENLPSHKLLNDISDMLYVATGTYFDGVLSSENKVPVIHSEVKKVLSWLGV